MRQPISRYHVAYTLLVVTLCVYGFRGLPTHPWSYGDLDHITHARMAQSDPAHIVAHNVKEPTRIILNIYFFVAYKVFGENPAAFHAAKIALHILNSLLLAYVFFSLFKDQNLAALSGLLFATHGAHYEAIYHIASTGHLISGAFALSALLFTHFYQATRSKIYFLGSILAYSGGIFSWEGSMGVLIPLVYIWSQNQIAKKRNLLFPIALCLPIAVFFAIDHFAFGYMSYKSGYYAAGMGWHIPHTFLLFIGRLFINSHVTLFDGHPYRQWTFLESI